MALHIEWKGLDWNGLVPRRLWGDAAAMAAGALAAWFWRGGFEGVLASAWWIACVVVIRSDLERYIIPDEASLAIAATGLAAAGSRAWPDMASAADPAVGAAAAGAAAAGAAMTALATALGWALLQGAAGFMLFWLVALIYRSTAGREGLGFGDVKLSGACAVWLDFADQAAALEIAAVAALALVLLARRRGAAIPFGAFLAPAAWLVFVFGPSLHAMLDRWP